jgi:hypothetical protein
MLSKKERSVLTYEIKPMKPLFLMKYYLLLFSLLTGAVAIAQQPDSDGIIYVKPTATGSGNGSSWANATSNLHDAIHVAEVKKVFVAIGTYRVGDQTEVAYYQIQRSRNGRDYHTVGEIPGDNRGRASHLFTDPAPLVGTSYYRIRQTDTDGTYSYSPITSLSVTETPKLIAYPNPVQSLTTLHVGIEYIGTNFRLVNALGRELTHFPVVEQHVSIDLDRYAPGIYFVHTNDGRILRLVKN